MTAAVLVVLFMVVLVSAGGSKPYSTEFLLQNDRNETNLILTMKESLIPTLNKVSSQRFPDSGTRNLAIATALRQKSLKSQESVLKLLNLLKAEYTSYWISNKIYVKNATDYISEWLEKGKENLMYEISPEPVLYVQSNHISSSSKPEGYPWNIEFMNVPDTRTITKGAGIRVALIDTGVRGSHQELRDNYVGSSNGGWLDPVNNTTEPVDVHGHGTHACGIICGKKLIGVAPQAQWMACSGCNGTGVCLGNALLSCGQWVVCPKSGMQDPWDCSNTPHIVANSWVFEYGNTSWYNDVISVWNAAHVIPIFSVGLEGWRGCSSAVSPATDKVIPVGKMLELNVPLSWGVHSGFWGSVGPQGVLAQQFREILSRWIPAPLITAPAQNISSAYIYSDSSYSIEDSFSDAVAHTAGAVALILSCVKSKTVSVVNMKRLLCQSARDDKIGDMISIFAKNRHACGYVPQRKHFNYASGCGVLDAYKALQNLSSIASNTCAE